MELTTLSISEALRLIERRELSPLVRVEAHLERVERIDEVLRCFNTLDNVRAVEQAHEAEESLRRGEQPGPLF